MDVHVEKTIKIGERQGLPVLGHEPVSYLEFVQDVYKTFNFSDAGTVMEKAKNPDCPIRTVEGFYYVRTKTTQYRTYLK